MRTTFVTMVEGEFEVTLADSELVGFRSANTFAVARYMVGAGVEDFNVSSSMDFAQEYGYPWQDARGDLCDALEVVANVDG